MENIILAVKVRNPVYNRHGTIDAEIEHPIHGWIPFTASPDDDEQHGRFIWEYLTDPSRVGEIAPYVKSEEEYLAEAETKRSEMIALIDSYATNPIVWEELSEDDQQAFKAARKALKEAHEQEGWPREVVWPKLPEVYA